MWQKKLQETPLAFFFFFVGGGRDPVVFLIFNSKSFEHNFKKFATVNHLKTISKNVFQQWILWKQSPKKLPSIGTLVNLFRTKNSHVLGGEGVSVFSYVGSQGPSFFCYIFWVKSHIMVSRLRTFRFYQFFLLCNIPPAYLWQLVPPPPFLYFQSLDTEGFFFHTNKSTKNSFGHTRQLFARLLRIIIKRKTKGKLLQNGKLLQWFDSIRLKCFVIKRTLLPDPFC